VPVIIDPRRRLVAVHLGFMRQHFDPYFDAARIPLSNPGLQRQEHLLEALAVELAQLGGLGVGQANDGPPERTVNRLHRNLVPLGKLGVLRHRRHRLPAPLRDLHDMIGDRLIPHSQPLQVQGLGLNPARDDTAVGQYFGPAGPAHRTVRIARLVRHGPLPIAA
jgi:hypothetical protein